MSTAYPSRQAPELLGTPRPPAANWSARFAEEVDAILATARRHLGLDVAWLSEFSEGEQVFRALDGDAASFGFGADRGLPLAGSFCQRVVDGRLPAVVPDTGDNAVTRELEVTEAAGIGSYLGAPVGLADGRLYGMLCAASHAARRQLDERDGSVLHVLAGLIAERIDRTREEVELRRMETEAAGVDALLAALAARDHYTGEHSQAVVDLSGAVARGLGLAARAVAEVEQVALLHDIGKLGIPDSILHKPGPLTECEWEVMRQHSEVGGRIVASIPSLAHLEPAVRGEHERWDGGGYPDGLAGEAIPLASRIILVADAFHAMTSDRPYRRAMAVRDARRELSAHAGTQFDPRVVAALLRLL